MNARSLVTVVLSLFFSTAAFGFGFEKTIPFGGRTAGVAGIATSYISGSESIFFNPAGLAAETNKSNNLTLDLSPTILVMKAPIENPAVQDKNKDEIVLPGGFTYSRKINEDWGVGAGLYIAGGSRAQFSFDFPGFAGGQEAKTDLLITEFALGAGYRVNEKLKLGAAWRIGVVNGSMATIARTGSGGTTRLNQLYISNARDTQFTGFKLGAQYKLDDKTDIGLTYRSEMNYQAKGTLRGTSFIPNALGGGVTNISDADVTVGAVFPQAINLGASHALTDTWKLLAEYTFTEYSKVTNLSINAPTTTSPTGGDIPSELHFKDKHAVRVGAEYAGFSWPIRMGYMWVSQVTNDDYALPTMAPPGDGQLLTVGTGQAWGDFRIDGAFEYIFPISKVATNKAVGNDLNEYVIHLGSSYSF